MSEEKLTAAETGTREAKLKAAAAAFLDEVLELLTAELENVKAANRTAEDYLRDAVAAYTEDLEARKSVLQKKIDSLTETLQDSAAKAEQAVENLSAALSSDDEVGETAAREEVDAAALEEFQAKRQLETLERVTLSGKKELYYATLDAYHAVLRVRADSEQTCAILIALCDELTEQLKAIRDDAERWRNRAEPAGRTTMRRVWPVIEANGGPVDFIRAIAGDENNCKLRYLEALVHGSHDPAFSDSPAGERLAHDIQELSERE